MCEDLRFRSHFPRLLWPALLAVLFLAGVRTYGQPVGPTIAFVFPPGAERGQTLEVTVVGSVLRGATAVYVSGNGVTGKILSEARFEPPDKNKRGEVPKGKPKPWINTQMSSDVIRVSLTLAAGAELGQRDLRLVTPAGISKRCRFVVDDLPQVATTQPNIEKAAPVRVETLPLVVNGQIYSGWQGTQATVGSPDRAYYRFSVKAGQTLIYEIQAQALIPYVDPAVPGWLDACLTLFDPSGRRIMYCDDFRFHPDPLLVHKVQKDGEYTLEVRDTLYRSSHEFVYRLRMGELPYLTHVFPLGGRRGSEVKLELHGVNLSKDSLAFKIPADSPDMRAVSVVEKGLSSNALPFAAGDLPEITSTGPNHSLSQASRVSLPVTINGRIRQVGEADFFAFHAEADQSLVMEVHARRLDSPLDSILTLYDQDGKKLDENDDPPPQAVPNRLGTDVESDQSFFVEPADVLERHTADSRLGYKFSKAGDYVVRIRDVQDKAGEEYAYRLTIAPRHPDFVLRLHTDSARLAPLDSAVLAVSALRKDGFDGEIALAVQGLPKGFTASRAVIPAGKNETQLTITAPADAQPGLFSPVVVGTATVDNQPVTHPALPVESVIQAFYVKELVPTQGCLVEVKEGTGFSLTTNAPADQPLEIPQGGSAEVVVKAVRKEDGKSAINLSNPSPFQAVATVPNSSSSGAAVWLKMAPLPADKDEVTITLNANSKAPVGLVQNIVISGTMQTGKTPITRTAPAIVVKIVPQKPKSNTTSRPTPKP